MFLSDGAIVPPQVDTLADRTPIFADASYYGESSLELLGRFSAYSAIYKSQLWVGTVVRKLAMATARMPFDVKIALNDTDSKPEAGPLTDLLRRPNPRMSGFKLWQWTSSTRDIYGEAFWLKLRDNRGRVRELHPMHPSNVIVRRNGEGGLEYIYSAGTRNVSQLPAIPEEDVVSFTSYNPDNIARGLSNLEGLRMTLLNEDASRRATASMWAKGARPSVMLGTDKTLTDNAIKRLRAQFDAAHSGADNFGSTVVFEEGVKAQIVQLNSEEMQYIESRKLNREEVCASYDVPPPVVHILDHATFSNITEQLRSQYRDTMAPRFVDNESVIEHQLVPDFYNTGDVFTRFNMDEVLRGDFETKAKAAVAMRNAGLLTGNQGLAMFGMPRSEEPNMDLYFANASLVPLGTPAQRVTITEQGTQTPAQQAEAADTAAGGATAASEDAVPAKKLTLRAVQGRLARVKDSKPELRQKLVDEHAKEIKGFFARQHAAVKAAVSEKAAGVFDPTEWDGELGSILHTLSQATADAIGRKVAADLGGKYDGSDIADWLQSDAEDTATRINQTTADQIAAAIERADTAGDAVDQLFDGEIEARSDQISLSRVTMLAGFASLLAAQQSDVKTKTWVTGTNPRSAHQEMDGETVPLGERFSNGMDGPGDPAGGVDEIAGCNCDLSFSL